MSAPRRISAAAVAGLALLAAGCSSKSSTTPVAAAGTTSASATSAAAPTSAASAAAPGASSSASAGAGGAVPKAIAAAGGTTLLTTAKPAGVEAQYGPICKGSDLGIPKIDLKTDTIGWAQSEKEANPFRIQSTKSQIDEAKKRGIHLITTNAQSNVQQENTDIKGMIDKGAKAIIFSPINSTGLGDAIAYAKSKHVAMIPVDRNITGVTACKDVGPQLGSDFVQQGKRAADAMIKATGGKANLLILLGATGVNVTDDRTNGFLDELAAQKATGIKIIAKQTADFTREKGQSVTETEIKAHPEINAIYAENDEEGVGALVALTDAGKNGISKTHLVSIDGTKTAVQGVVDGNFDAVIESNPAFGPAAEDALAAYVNGDGYPAVTITTDEAYLDKASAQTGISSGTAY
ncbi:MAG: galactofuranose transport system substrate-binding protein [Frankiales bacterium]|jgi:ribose transport system substrate-binding protein|nr:galactofuranose transport system substrate-binding protein [Frankiales bacterium]